MFKQRWYVVARSPYYGAIRIYSLDRILHLRTTEKRFKLPKDFHPETFFKQAFGIIVDETIEPCVVKIKAFGNKRKYLQTLPLHHSQEETETAESYAVFSYFIAPTFDFKQEILSHGDEIEVVSPEWFREEMEEVVRKMSNFYQKNLL